MTQAASRKPQENSPAKASLLERAAQVYDFKRASSDNADILRAASARTAPLQPPKRPDHLSDNSPKSTAGTAQKQSGNAESDDDNSKKNKSNWSRGQVANTPVGYASGSTARRQHARINTEKLVEMGFIDPRGSVTSTAEEFRIVKRQLLKIAENGDHPHSERILVCSANPDEGKTFCAVNLALSIAAEQDVEVLLVDADFAKPSMAETLGLEAQYGLMDALTNPNFNVEDAIIYTDIPNLALLHAGRQSNNDTEYLASSRTRTVLNRLTENNPSRIVIFDSPPALAASPASELALHVGQVLMVVRADVTSEFAVKDALDLLSGCETISLLLNGAKFSPTGRNFGSYYGYGEKK